MTPYEQRSIPGGADADIIAGICAVTLPSGPVGCIVASVVVTAAGIFLDEKGSCRYRLRVRELPTVGGVRCV